MLFSQESGAMVTGQVGVYCAFPELPFPPRRISTLLPQEALSGSRTPHGDISITTLGQ
jgi:hypothetical protein